GISGGLGSSVIWPVMLILLGGFLLVRRSGRSGGGPAGGSREGAESAPAEPVIEGHSGERIARREAENPRSTGQSPDAWGFYSWASHTSFRQESIRGRQEAAPVFDSLGSPHSQSAGSHTQNDAPSPALPLLDTSIRPPCRSTISRAIASPSPVPAEPVSLATCPRKKRSNT